MTVSTGAWKQGDPVTILRFVPFLLVALCVGCISPLAYSPNAGLVDSMGDAAAEEEFAKVLKRSQTPEIREVTVEGDQFAYQWRGQAGPAGVYPLDGQRAIYFANVTRIDIYENFRAFAFNNDLRLADFHFNSLGDAQRFADLVYSFKARMEGGGGNGE